VVVYYTETDNRVALPVLPGSKTRKPRLGSVDKERKQNCSLPGSPALWTGSFAFGAPVYSDSKETSGIGGMLENIIFLTATYPVPKRKEVICIAEEWFERRMNFSRLNLRRTIGRLSGFGYLRTEKNGGPVE
jgi:hypothetical protein